MKSHISNVDQENREQSGSTNHGVEFPRSSYFARKEFAARTLALIALVLLSPIILLLVLIMRLTSPGPGLFRQARVGKDGRVFDVIKIRTMYNNAEKHSGPVWCVQQDPRITPVGRFYRFLHLDELPQLINVVRGEMCLIGPRPERPEIIARDSLMSEIPGYQDRLRVLPGITGLAQINLPPDVSVDCVRRKVKLDLRYIEEASLGLDLRILMCTGLRMCGLRHGIAAWLLRVRYTVTDDGASGSKIVVPAHKPRKRKAKAPQLAAALSGGNALADGTEGYVPSLMIESVDGALFEEQNSYPRDPLPVVKPR